MTDRPHTVLFLCTGNSARSQMAEALMNRKAQGKFVASSAGSHPASLVNPLAIEALRAVGIDWAGHEPRGFDSLVGKKFDFVITVCNNAKEACPVLPGHPVHAHWGMEDPAEADGSDVEKSRAFVAARALLSRRIDLMLALPIEKLKRVTVGRRLDEIAAETEPSLEKMES
jgi:arsenate reductase